MKRRRPPGIWVTNHRANPVLRPLLHGPAGRRLGRRLALIRYRGRRTGRVYELPVQYARDGDRVWILPGAPGYKTWWRNLRGGAGAELVVAGHDRHGHATVIGRSQPPEFAESLTAYLRANPRARRTPSCPGTLHQHPPTAGCGRSAMARCWSVSTLMIEPRDLTPPGVLSNAPILTVTAMTRAATAHLVVTPQRHHQGLDHRAHLMWARLRLGRAIGESRQATITGMAGPPLMHLPLTPGGDIDRAGLRLIATAQEGRRGSG